jgi:hypothetical protein
MGYDLMEVGLGNVATIIAVIVGLVSLIGLILHHDRKHLRLELKVDNIEKELSNLKPLQDVLNAFATISQNPAIRDLAKHIHPPGVKCNPYDPAEKNRLIDRYGANTLDATGAKRLQEMLTEDLELASDNAAGAIAVGVLLVGVGALIERLARMGGRAH